MRRPLIATKPATPVLWAGAVLVLLGLAPAVGRADVILGNLGAGDGGNVQTSANKYTAASFTMGGQAYSLSDVQIRITGNGNAGATFQLRADASGQPSSSALFTFDSQSITGFSTNTDTFPAGSPFTLTANNTYWLVGLTTNGSINWADSSPQTNPSGSGATFNTYALSPDAGTTWTNTSSDAPKFQLDGTPSTGVPEPSSLVLVGTVACVAAAVGLLRRRNRRPGLADMTARSTNGT
jgi:hypothetical protein